MKEDFQTLLNRRNDVLHSLSLASEVETLDHLGGFANGFMQQYRKKEWRKIFLKEPERCIWDSPKIPNHLNKKYCSLIKSDLFDFVDKNKSGMFWNFGDVAYIATTCQAFVLSNVQMESDFWIDALFSIEAGKLCVFFSREQGIWLCKRDSKQPEIKK